MIKRVKGKIEKVLNQQATAANAVVKTYSQAEVAKSARDGKRLSEWADFLKDDFDEDYGCVLRVLWYKLKRTRDSIVSRNIVVGADETGREISEVMALLDRVIADEYVWPLRKAFEKEHGGVRHWFRKVSENSSVMEMSIGGKKPTAKMWRKYSALSRQADREKERDLKKAFSLMAAKMFSWWD
jgi:hypothetical protein